MSVHFQFPRHRWWLYTRWYGRGSKRFIFADASAGEGLLCWTVSLDSGSQWGERRPPLLLRVIKQRQRDAQQSYGNKQFHNNSIWPLVTLQSMFNSKHRSVDRCAFNLFQMWGPSSISILGCFEVFFSFRCNFLYTYF